MSFSVPAHSTKTDKMNVNTRERLVILGAFLSISVGLNECVSTYFIFYIWLVKVYS